MSFRTDVRFRPGQAKAWLDGRTKQARVWFTTARRQLRQGQVNRVLEGIEAALALEGLPTSAYEALTKVHNYLVCL